MQESDDLRQVTFREAGRDDLPKIVEMLADDKLGQTRERYADPLPASYYAAFDAIDRDPNNRLIVADVAGQVAGVCQLTFIPNISFVGSWRANIEGVRVVSTHRGQQIGQKMIEHCIDLARQKGCIMAQLTSNKQRPDAIRFYERLGFQVTHAGMKLAL